MRTLVNQWPTRVNFRSVEWFLLIEKTHLVPSMHSSTRMAWRAFLALQTLLPGQTLAAGLMVKLACIYYVCSPFAPPFNRFFRGRRMGSGEYSSPYSFLEPFFLTLSFFFTDFGLCNAKLLRTAKTLLVQLTTSCRATMTREVYLLTNWHQTCYWTTFSAFTYYIYPICLSFFYTLRISDFAFHIINLIHLYTYICACPNRWCYV